MMLREIHHMQKGRSSWWERFQEGPWWAVSSLSIETLPLDAKKPLTRAGDWAYAWKGGLIVVAVLLWLSCAAGLLWLGQGSRLPLDWHGLWDAGPQPQLRPTLLGVQDLRWGAAIKPEAKNTAFSLGGDAAVHLGRWEMPAAGQAASFGAWLKINGELPQSNLVALAGTAPPNEWGFGAWNGKPAAWFTELKTEGRSAFRIVSNETWPAREWVHLMVVVEPSRCTLLVNGRRAAQKQADFDYPDDTDVWLGTVRRTLSRFNILPLPERFGLEAPEFLLDDFVVYARPLSEAEVNTLVQAGRGGLILARQRLELRARLTPRMVPWMAVAGLLLLGFAFSKDIRFYTVRGTKYFLRPEFLSTWIILLLGTSVTLWISLRLAKAAVQSDRERMDLFCERLVEAADTHFERVADVLRRARDVARLNPEISLTGWSRWARENGFPYDFPAVDGIGWARRIEAKVLPTVLQPIRERAGPVASHWQSIPHTNQWQLPVTAFRWGGIHRPADSYALVGWNWLTSLEQTTHPDGPRAELLASSDVAATGLVLLRPVPTEPSRIRGVQLYLPVYRSASPRPERRNGYLVGVVFAGVRLAEMVRSYWHGKPPLFGARLITGTPNSREALAVDTGDLLPETRRPEKPYLEKEVAIRTYGRRIWVQVWTTRTFRSHSKRYWPWLSASIGAFFTLLATSLVAVQTRGRLKEKSAATELRAALDKLRAAQQEREAISRDIHDGAIQSLYAIQLHLERVGTSSKKEPHQPLSQEIASTRAGLDGVIAELRQFTVFDNPEPVPRERMGLCGVLQSFVERARASTSTELHLRCVPEAGAALSDSQAVQLANIAREALSNSLRHGAPRHVQIIFEPLIDGVRLEIADDGSGFDPEAPRTGLGLDNMRTRSREAGGTLRIQSAPGKGTRVSVTIPVNKPAQTKENDD